MSEVLHRRVQYEPPNMFSSVEELEIYIEDLEALPDQDDVMIQWLLMGARKDLEFRHALDQLPQQPATLHPIGKVEKQIRPHILRARKRQPLTLDDAPLSHNGRN